MSEDATCRADSGNKPRRNERVLVIDDDPGIQQCVECILQIQGYHAIFTASGRAGLDRARSEAFDLVITDLRLPDITGLEVVRELKALDEEIPVILMTSFSSVQSAVEALRIGAIDYLIKPFANDEFAFAVARAIDERRMRRENEALRYNLKQAYTTQKIIGESDAIKRVLALIKRVAATDANVLIQGESGTGKELVAQAIHFSSKCADGPFVPVNCGAIPTELLESELFGHTKGAFTGATTASEGLIRQASGGTLFLDEISELPLNLQVKLLRVIQERQVRPVGSAHGYLTDTRFLAASNRDLKAEVAKGSFRADLYYRLNVISVHIPALRERGKDIEVLAQYFVQQHSRKMGKRIKGVGNDLMRFLLTYDWPGNVRELENLIERAVILSEGDILTCDELLEITPVEETEAVPLVRLGDPLSIEDYIKEVVKQYQDCRSEIELAAMLGIGRKALWVRRRRWGIYRSGGQGRAEPENLDEADCREAL